MRTPPVIAIGVVVDIDADTLRPRDTLRTLDDWRGVRQDIRTGMARSRC